MVLAPVTATTLATSLPFSVARRGGVTDLCNYVVRRGGTARDSTRGSSLHVRLGDTHGD